MADPLKSGIDPGDVFSSWMKISSNFLSAMTKIWSQGSSSILAGQSTQRPDSLSAMWAAQFKTWQVLQKGFGDVDTLDAVSKVLATLPDLSMRLMQTGLNGLTMFQKRWTERLRKTGESEGGYDFSDLDRDFLNRWTEAYKEEFQKFLKIPQLGLTRFYQEKFNEALDRYYLFQAATTEFLHLLTVPVEKSMQLIHTQLAELAGQGRMPEDTRQIYQMWVKVLEGHYMTLFQSEEYTSTLGKTIAAMNEFIAIRQEVIEDVLKTVPVPSQKEFDELCHEIYLLKKRVRKLEHANGSKKRSVAR
jgi:class III poly(R)-hydroxyalkanoic acid synthase PhaE subunit